MSKSITEVLRETLAQIEQSEDCQPNDPAMTKLRLAVAKKVANLQAAKELPQDPGSIPPLPGGSAQPQ